MGAGSLSPVIAFHREGTSSLSVAEEMRMGWKLFSLKKNFFGIGTGDMGSFGRKIFSTL
jgi:hypothetical protein